MQDQTAKAQMVAALRGQMAALENYDEASLSIFKDNEIESLRQMLAASDKRLADTRQEKDREIAVLKLKLAEVNTSKNKCLSILSEETSTYIRIRKNPLLLGDS